MSYRRWGTSAGVAAVVMALILAGCSSKPRVADVTLDEAKAELFAIEAEILDLVPEEYVTGRRTQVGRVTSLLRCGDGLQYPGQETLDLVPGDYSQYVAEAETLIRNLPGTWTTIPRKKDYPRTQLVNEETGMTFLVAILNGRFTILSGSVCFKEFDGYSPHEEY